MTFRLQAVLLPPLQGTSTPVSPVAVPVPLQGHPSRYLSCFKVSTVRKTKGAKSEVFYTVSFPCDCKISVFPLQQRCSCILSSRMPTRKSHSVSQIHLGSLPLSSLPGTHRATGGQGRHSIPCTRTSQPLCASPPVSNSHVPSSAVTSAAAHMTVLQHSNTPAFSRGHRAADPARSTSVAASPGSLQQHVWPRCSSPCKASAYDTAGTGVPWDQLPL